MPSSSDQPSATRGLNINLSSLVDCACVMPYMLGYQPKNTTVVIASHGTSVQLVSALEVEDMTPARLDEFAHKMATATPFTAIILVYTHDADYAIKVIELLRDTISPNTITLTGRVDDSTLWDGSVDPTLTTGGVSFDPTTSVAAITAIAAGLQVTDSIDVITASIAGPEGRELREAEHRYIRASDSYASMTTDQRHGFLRTILTLHTAHPHADDDPSDATCATAGVLVNDVDLTSEFASILFTTNHAGHVRFWTRVIATCPPRWAIIPLAILGFHAFASNQHTLFTEALRRADALDSNHVGTRLLRYMYTHNTHHLT